MEIALLVAALLSQTTPPSNAPATDAEAAQRAAAAAERSAAAAERAAAAMEALVQKMSAPSAAPAAAPAAAPEAAPGIAPATGESPWTGSVGLNLIALTGNSETLTVSTTGTGSRDWGPWKLSLKLAAAYGQTRVEDVTDFEVTALNAMGQVRGDRKLTSIASAFLLVGADTDHVKSVEYRAYGEGGAAITWLERKEGDEVVLLLRTDLGLRYANESRFQYYPTPLDIPDISLLAPKLGLGFRYAVSKDVAFVEEAEVLTNVMGEPRWLINSLTRINARLTESLAINVGFEIKHDSLPAQGKKPTDTILSVGAELAF